METIEKYLRPVIDNVQEALLDVYDDWLNKHALLDPKEWAEGRMDWEEFEAYGEETALSNTKFEYENLGGKNFEIEFFNTNKEYFKSFFREVKNDIINHNYEELEYAKTHEDEDEIERLEEDITTLENLDFDNDQDFNQFVAEYYYIDEYMEPDMANNLLSNLFFYP